VFHVTFGGQGRGLGANCPLSQRRTVPGCRFFSGECWLEQLIRLGNVTRCRPSYRPIPAAGEPNSCERRTVEYKSLEAAAGSRCLALSRGSVAHLFQGRIICFVTRVSWTLRPAATQRNRTKTPPDAVVEVFCAEALSHVTP